MFESLPVCYNAFCLALENKLEVLRCMASLNIYDEGVALQQSQSVCEAVASISVLTADVAGKKPQVFSAIARQMKVRTSSLDQAHFDR